MVKFVIRDKKTGKRVELSPIHETMLDFVQYCREDIKKNAMIIGMPRHGKSAIVVDPYPLYEWGKYGTNRQIKVICGNEKLVTVRVDTARDYIEGKYGPEYNLVFPHVERDKSHPWRLSDFYLKRNVSGDPSLWGHSILGAGEGSGCQVIIFDDPVTRVNAVKNPKLQIQVINAIEGTWLPRLDPPDTFAIYVCNAWTSTDATAHIKKEHLDAWCIIELGVADDYSGIEQRVYGDI